MATWDAIFLGNTDRFNIDPLEGNASSEYASRLVGASYGSGPAPLYEAITRVTTIDQRGETGALDTSNADTRGPDQVSYDLGSGTVTASFEGMGVYNATVTFLDGRVAQVSAVIFQDEARNLFLAPETGANADSAAFRSGPILSIRLDSLITGEANLATARNAQDFVICFTAGTLIATPEGPRPVEDLRPGDLVMTVDEGAQPLRWIGRRRLDVSGHDRLKPVRIRAGALGRGPGGQAVPAEDLTVSPQHRVLVRSAVAQRMFGTREVLVAARQLLALPGIEVVADASDVTYVHLLFDRHQLVTANGAVTESLFTGPEALKAVPPAARAEIMALFPGLAAAGPGEGIGAPPPVRPLIGGRQGRRLAERHGANAKPMVTMT